MTYATRITAFTLAASVMAAGAAFAQKPTPKAKPESQAALMKEAKITRKAATVTALAQVPGAKVKSSEIERENGKLIYSFDLSVKGKSGIEEINVDAITGAVVNHEHEGAKAEKAEAKAEKKGAPEVKK